MQAVSTEKVKGPPERQKTHLIMAVKGPLHLRRPWNTLRGGQVYRKERQSQRWGGTRGSMWYTWHFALAARSTRAGELRYETVEGGTHQMPLSSGTDAVGNAGINFVMSATILRDDITRSIILAIYTVQVGMQLAPTEERV